MTTANMTETVMPVPHISVIATVAGITVTDISGAVNAAVMAVLPGNAVGIEIKTTKKHETTTTDEETRSIVVVSLCDMRYQKKHLAVRIEYPHHGVCRC
jgi:hypothetical protein